MQIVPFHLGSLRFAKTCITLDELYGAILGFRTSSPLTSVVQENAATLSCCESSRNILCNPTLHLTVHQQEEKKMTSFSCLGELSFNVQSWIIYSTLKVAIFIRKDAIFHKLWALYYMICTKMCTWQMEKPSPARPDAPLPHVEGVKVS